MTTGLDGLRRFVDTCNDEETLSALNKALIDKLRELTNERTRRSMLSFRKGMRIAFRTGKKQGRYLVVGTIERMNVKTVSLSDCSDGMSWNVPPTLIREATPADEEVAQAARRRLVQLGTDQAHPRTDTV